MRSRIPVRLGKRSVIVTWLISYISVLLVPMMISGAVYAATWHVVESEVTRANESLLQQTEQAIDSNLRGIERLSVEIALNKQVAAFINATKPLTDNDYYELYSIANTLRVYKMANEYIEQIYLYYKNSDTVLSTRDHIDSRGLYEMLRQREDMSYEEWKAFFDKRYMQEYAPVRMKDGNQTEKAVMYAKSVLLDNPDQPGAVILFVIKDSKLLENTTSSNGSAVAVVDKMNRLVATTDAGSDAYPVPYDRLTEEKGFLYDETGGRKVAVSYTTSASNGWKYVSLVPAAVFDQKMEYMKKLIYGSVGLCILIGGVVTFWFLRKNYVPISLLIGSFATKSGLSFSGGSNEYHYLQDALNNTLTEKEKVDQRLKQHHNAIRSHFLRGLLNGRLDRNVPVHESLAAHDIRPESDHYAVLLFHIEHYGKLDASDYSEPQKVKLLQFIVMNVVEELAAQHHLAFATEMDEWAACIVNFRGEGDPEALRRLAEQTKRFLLEQFHVPLTVAISGIHQDLYNLPRAYVETLEAMEYRLVMGSGEVIGYDDLPKPAASGTGGYYYPLHVEQQLINFVKTGDYERSKAVIEEILSMNGGETPFSVAHAKCLMFDLIGTLLKTMDELGAEPKRRVMEHVDPLNRLIACETIKEMEAELRDVLERVCRTIEEDRKTEANPIGRQVMEHVQRHYSDENLNISSIGEAFGLTPSYLSKQFKTQTGEALLDYINRTRLEAAKALLAQQALPVAEIARQVGYGDINTFNRIFKKFEGITPGKYRGVAGPG
ncbi:helix-turn-helix domain-containing protein [Paenibacillus sp. HJGM_3]|uniref:helix-turn-helix domain-containing protein n=1 Tax=Paenibacillus sp. HJGM_3 TaxID=3379816 RepID=UPI00385BEFBB